MVRSDGSTYFVTTMVATTAGNWTNEPCYPIGFAQFAYITTFVIGMPANILAFYTFCRKVHRKPTPIDILLLNLTISDLIFLIFLPLKMKEAADNGKWILPRFLCPITGFLFYSTIYNSTLLLTAVSVERYLSVACPVRFTAPGRVVKTQVACVIFWITSFANCSIVLQMELSKSPDDIFCYDKFSKKQLIILNPVRLELFVILFCVPFLICTFCYVNFIRILSQIPNITRHRRMRAIGLAIGTLVVFTLCFGPYNVSHLFGMIDGKVPCWRKYALLLTTFNACLDPIIFYLSSSAVRSRLSICLKKIKVQLNPKATSAQTANTPEPMDSIPSSSQRFCVSNTLDIKDTC
ncbi:free fatty acid receptor 3 [Esox lucius]|uniref:G-protein coupled receptors family 1 profile domain-containing protein n=1 Tax=Esox lucius TaxID=8010 RepID=A0AAY5KNG0_ESOLU|nr:free fatty acid receptor 3 [Esox lucius]